MTIYFAWVVFPGTGGVQFGPEHLVHDESIISFRVEHNEGDFAKLIIDVENPRIGPLAPGHPVWAWLSWQEGTVVVPLFFGRLIGIPSNIIGNIITYEFIARPSNYQAVKMALADTMRMLPFYDEIFIDPAKREDPDAVLEGYSKVWHIDRVTHEVTASDVLVGEDGIEEFSGPEIIYDSVNISMDRVPLSKVMINGEIPWTQQMAFSSGTIDLGQRFLNNTASADSWPVVGASLAGGYVVVNSFAKQQNPNPHTTTVNFSYINREKKHRDGDTMSIQESFTAYNGRLGGVLLSSNAYVVVGDPSTGTPAEGGREEHALAIAGGSFSCSMSIAIDAEGERKEAVSLLVTSDLQPVLKDPDDDSDYETIDLNTTDVAKECLEPGDDPTIVNPGRGEYVTTERGLQSVQYMIAVARARLCVGARCVNVTWECPFGSAVNLSCRKNARIFDPRIPGGEAMGKIVAYSLRGDGISGEFRGSVTIACAVGLGNAIATSPGTADYVDESYVDDYQTFTGQIVALPSGDIGYSPPTLVSGGGGFAFPSRSDIVIRDEIVEQAAEEDPTENVTNPDLNPMNATSIAELMAMNAKKFTEQFAKRQVWREIELLNLSKQANEAEFSVTTTPLVIPRQIDLTADVTA